MAVFSSSAADLVEKTAVVDISKALSTHPTGDITNLPYDIVSNDITITLENASEGFPFKCESDGLKLTGGSGTNEYSFKISAGNNAIQKVVLVLNDWVTEIIVGGTDLTDQEEYVGFETHYTWTRPDSYLENDVEVTAISVGSRWGNGPSPTLLSMQVTYMADTGGLQVANLSVKEKEVIASLGDKMYDPAANITNPSNVDLTWASSNPDVVVVGDNGVEIVGAGISTLSATVASEGFEAQTVEYDINVINEAMTLPQMSVLAPENGETVRVYKYLTFVVNRYVSSSYKYEKEDGTEATMYQTYLFVSDFAKGDPAILYRESGTSTSYRTDNLIEGNWTATNLSRGGMEIWGGAPTASTSVPDFFQSPKKVTNLSGLTMSEVVELVNVKLPDGVVGEQGQFEGQLSDGTTVKLYNLLPTTSSAVVGVYDIVGALGTNDNGEEVFIGISYELRPDYAESITITTDPNGVEVEQNYDDEEGMIMVSLTGTVAAESVKVTIRVPNGWNGSYYKMQEVDFDHGVLNTSILKAPESNWVPVEALVKDGFKVGNEIVFATDKIEVAQVYFYKNGQADKSYSVVISCMVESDENTGIAAIEGAEAEAEYFNLQGVKVATPTPGVYVKVVDGKATKVVVR